MQSSTLLCAISMVLGAAGACGGGNKSNDSASSNSVGGAVGSSSGGRSAVGGNAGTGSVLDVPLSSLDTEAEARSVCDLLNARISPTDYQKLAAGRCAAKGLLAASAGQGDCSSIAQTCVKDTPPAVGSASNCMTSSFPQCDDVSVREYVDCSAALVTAGLDYYGYFTCASDPSALEAEMQTPVACEAPFARCAAFASTW